MLSFHRFSVGYFIALTVYTVLTRESIYVLFYIGHDRWWNAATEI